MNEQDALLAAIIANPDEDTPRLIYADWLQENGQEERAEFIRKQCWLWAHPSCSNCTGPEWSAGKPCAECRQREEYRERCRRLFSLSLGWSWPFAGEYDWFERGMVERMECEAKDWLHNADAITRQHPVRKVTLTTWPRVLTLIANGIVLGWKFDGRDKIHEAQPAGAMLKTEWPGIEFELPPSATLQFTGGAGGSTNRGGSITLTGGAGGRRAPATPPEDAP